MIAYEWGILHDLPESPKSVCILHYSISQFRPATFQRLNDTGCGYYGAVLDAFSAWDIYIYIYQCVCIYIYIYEQIWHSVLFTISQLLQRFSY